MLSSLGQKNFRHRYKMPLEAFEARPHTFCEDQKLSLTLSGLGLISYKGACTSRIKISFSCFTVLSYGSHLDMMGLGGRGASRAQLGWQSFCICTMLCMACKERH